MRLKILFSAQNKKNTTDYLLRYKLGQFIFDTKKKAMEMILMSKLTKNLPEYVLKYTKNDGQLISYFIGVVKS